MINQTNRTSYPYSAQRKLVGTDGLGNEVLPGDPILTIHDEFFLVETLEENSVEILEVLGATYRVSK